MCGERLKERHMEISVSPILLVFTGREQIAVKSILAAGNSAHMFIYTLLLVPSRESIFYIESH